MQLTTQMYHQGQITYKQKINVSMIALLVQVLFCYNGNQEVKGHIRLKFKNHIILVADSFCQTIPVARAPLFSKPWGILAECLWDES